MLDSRLITADVVTVKRAASVLCITLLFGCGNKSTQPGGPVFTPGAATLLSVGSTNKDEDPSARWPRS
jgi:hypothetical protein